MNEAKNYTIQVLNDQYVIKTDEAQEQVDEAAQLVNALMYEIVEKNKYIDHKKAAVLAALRVASQLVDLQTHQASVQRREQELADMIQKQLSFGMQKRSV